MNKPEKHLWSRGDWITGGFCAAVSFAVYAWTVAPSVTLLDSGEFLLAAAEFGVPHPTGYPLWTILAWLFQLVLPGNPALTIALFSGFCGGLAVGFAGVLISGAVRWIFPALGWKLRGTISVAWALAFAFCEPMWSQATIAEVYTLHVLIVVALLMTILAMIHRPGSRSLLLLAFFLLALGFSNHHLILTVAPLPFLVVLLLERRRFPEVFFASMLTAALFLLLLAAISERAPLWQTAVRFAWLFGAAWLAFLWIRKFRVDWKLPLLAPLVVAAGLLPYAYMPLASSTNPPMNWGYARDLDGFFYSINRTQYGGSLDELLVRTLGRAVGTSGYLSTTVEERPVEPWQLSRQEEMQRWSGFFWVQLGRSFTIPGILFFLASLLLVRSRGLEQRTFLYVLFVGFFLAGFLHPFLEGASTDLPGWWLQMPYHGYSFLFFAIPAAFGSALVIEWLAKRKRAMAIVLAALVGLIPLWGFFANYAVCSQRDRWFGWKLGVEMLRDLPPGSVLFGGTDAGRFVPTWMILGESFVRPEWKRDPDFDRRDLYILTQNALADPFYLRYVRDHYSQQRPSVETAFERWLGREHRYPEAPLIFPDKEEVLALFEQEGAGDAGNLGAHGGVAEWIFLNNKNQHDFFLEESIPMEWSYPYAVPHGLILRLLPEPIHNIPEEVVLADMTYWDDLLGNFVQDPLFVTDYDAKRTFSSLRNAQGNVYLHHGRNREAEIAFRQSLVLLPSNLAALVSLSNQLWDRGDFQTANAHWDEAIRDDPNSEALQYLRAVAHQREAWEEQFRELRAELRRNPRNTDARKRLVSGLFYVAEDENALEALREGISLTPPDPEFLEFAVARAREKEYFEEGALAAENLVAVHPEDWRLPIQNAWFLNKLGRKEEAAGKLKRSIDTGGASAREAIRSIPKLEEALLQAQTAEEE